MSKQYSDNELGVIVLEEIDEIGGYSAWSGAVKSENDLMIELEYIIPPHDDIEPYIQRSKPFARAIKKDELDYRIKTATAIQKLYNQFSHYPGENELSVQDIAEELYAPCIRTSEVEFISSINPLTFVMPELIFLPEEYRYDLLTNEIIDKNATQVDIDSVIAVHSDVDEYYMPHLVYSTESTEKNVVVVIGPKMNFIGAFFE